MNGPGPFHVRLLDETTSTNDEIKRALEEGKAEGLVVRARRQTGGYGRQGRSWASPEGGLYASLLLRPRVEASALPTLSLVASIASREAIAKLLPEDERDRVLIKWPNDIVYLPSADDACGSFDGRNLSGDERVSSYEGGSALCDESASQRSSGFPRPQSEAGCATAAVRQGTRSVFRKLCGISLEAHAGGVCLGIGVNVLAPDARAGVSGKNVPVYLDELAGSAELVQRFETASHAGGAKLGATVASIENGADAAPGRSGASFRCHGAPHTSEAADGLPDGLSGKGSIPLASCDGLLGEVLDGILREFAPLYERWQVEGFAPYAKIYREHAALVDRFVRVEDRAGALVAEGRAEGVDDCGRLALRAPDGSLSLVQSGEVHLS